MRYDINNQPETINCAAVRAKQPVLSNLAL